MTSKPTRFPHQRDGLATALSEEPVLLEGMQVVFDETVGLYPVNLAHEDDGDEEDSDE